MANVTDKKSPSKATGAESLDDQIPFAPPEEGINLRHWFYRPEECMVADPKSGKMRYCPIQGYPVEVIERQQERDGRVDTYYQCAVLLTRPSRALQEVEGEDPKPITIKAGCVLLFTLSADPKVQQLQRLARNDSKSFEVWCCPVQQKSVGKGRNPFWDWDVRLLDPKGIDRVRPAMAELPGERQRPQLGGGNSEAQDTPF